MNPCQRRLQQGLQTRQLQAQRGRGARLLSSQEPAQMLQTWRHILFSRKMDNLSWGRPLWGSEGLQQAPQQGSLLLLRSIRSPCPQLRSLSSRLNPHASASGGL